ncbi:bifunctional diaminohydroxyphosphoribosylaminopyrimidine deaminase/5-amino-6-(5-phosphoribosylamino)uracil reductase RibD [Candidatus Anaplasma sp. TIGMIC]|uniref:bifunctional diaminohydroxyphosphoribosylaminopyrimidine deaminase/5-amino-6-(5-phosphoribosylamino)uracil reductase RibD n=1 Tax=Candidatus Anaplasma sp. TIGMIC TaxID=3020713 RepID=UPI00232C717E|nr:bifunctional diaminohydroxyphosphoribosylaminopyrimidine deaminase/5-amino-6-(5-phosphoribosylamino)uracil reductase RibD [Candidatus Anaplasma sp. TIGMIC]MDB1135348.1 bifunctional diaminohydroxyphosphoribosylaminopyrimidine deaminase/5-amino-6-(5-phosphoribosylamino)uracil reductase RibD [Candidatus Anaplasma sp. TIGMIC]
MSPDERFMAMALALARRGLGNVYPNPAVGCVITRDGAVVGRGWTSPGGRPHAETVALKQAGSKAVGSTVYVTLEPCCHVGVTGPCTTVLIDAGVSRVVIGQSDPDHRVSGKGISSLSAAGIDVVCGVLQHKAAELNTGFFNSKLLNRPLVTVKIATTLDGKISMGGHERSWITNDATRSWVHKQRAMHDAIMVGSNTVLADDPMLDCRLPGLRMHSPLRVVIDRSGKLQPHHRIVVTAGAIPTYVITDNEPAYTLDNVKYIKVNSGTVFLKESLCALTEQLGVTRLLVEGGGILITELLKKELVDRVIWTRSDKISGSGGVRMVNDIGPMLSKRCQFIKTRSLDFLGDTVEVFDVRYVPEDCGQHSCRYTYAQLDAVL